MSWPAPKWRLGGVLLSVLLGACARPPHGAYNTRLPDQAARPLPPLSDSVRGVAAGPHYNRHGGFYRAIFGAHYRRVWAALVAAPVLDLTRAAPGGEPLRFDKAGGGFQSISLSLQAPDGRAFALRALDKDPRKTLPSGLRNTFLLRAVRDATSAANPYAALVVPPLAEAVGIVPTHPQLVYVRPDETGLSELSGRFQGQLALLEEKYSGLADRSAALAGARELLDSEEMLARVYADPHQRIDAEALLRARLLDVWLGDWDRHTGQWQWATFQGKNGRTRFQALPKDRDQVFFRFDDGALPWLMSRLVPKFQTFRARYGSVRGLVRQARFLDERGLATCSRSDFQRAASQLRARLPDSLIGRALHRLPPAVYRLVGPGTAAALRARRAALPAAAAQFYRQLARRPVVGGTAGAERFVVRRTADSVTVSVFVPALGTDSLWFKRTFFPAETTQITLEGLAGADAFSIETPPDAGRRAGRIRVVVVGGAGADRVQCTGRARHVVYYDAEPAAAGSTALPPSLRPKPLPRRHRPYDRLSDD